MVQFATHQGYVVLLSFGNETFYDILGFDETRIKALGEFKNCLASEESTQLQLFIDSCFGQIGKETQAK